MKRKNLLISGVAIFVMIIIIYFTFSGSQGDDGIFVEVEKSRFQIDVMTSGSLEAKNSVKIQGPNSIRAYGIWNVTIQDLVDEGTLVKKGQYVARLDPSEVSDKLSQAKLNVDQKQSQFTQTQLDTTLTLREARDGLINLEYAVREKKLVLEQSQFEPTATIQKAQIELEKSKRALDQATENYQIKKRQSAAKMDEAFADLSKAKNQFEGLLQLSQQFTILAPEDGMLIYQKDWNGRAVKAGSQISAWDPTVAILPDLSKLLSKTYVNEVDIRKIEVGQPVEIGFDAFPEKKLDGKVIKVANVGEQRPNSDAKVFEVMVEVFGTDDLLKPGMTTSNMIITNELDEVLSIPIECLHSENDSITFVYKSNGLSVVKQEVTVGDANDLRVVILNGLEQGDRVSLSTVTSAQETEVKLLAEVD